MIHDIFQGSKKLALTLPIALSFITPLSLANEIEMQRILSSWNQQQQKHVKALRDATTDEDRQALLATVPLPNSIAKDLWKSMSKRTGTRLIPGVKGTKQPDRRVPTYEYDEAWAAPAVIWWLQHSDQLKTVMKPSAVEGTLRSLLNSVERIHYIHPDMADLCPTLAESASARSYDILKKILQSNSNPRSRAHAALAMSLLLKHENVSSIAGTPAQALGMRLAYIRYALENAPAQDYFGRLRLEDIAIEELYLLNNLTLGAIPPQIHVTSAQGQTEALPVVGEAQLFYFWSPLDAGSIALLRTAASLKSQFPYIKFKAITAGITGAEIAANPDMALEHVEHFVDTEGKAIQAYRIPKAGFAVLISPKARLLYIGEPNMKLQAAINTYDEERKKAQNTPSPPTLGSESPTQGDSDSSSTAPPLRELPDLSF